MIMFLKGSSSQTTVKSDFPLGGKERQGFALHFCTREKDGENQPALELGLQKYIVFYWPSLLE